MLDIKKIELAVNQISSEKKIPKESLIDIIESAIKTAYKKDYGNKDENVVVKLDLQAGTIEIIVQKVLVKEVTNSYTEISFDELGEDAEMFKEGDIIEIDMTDEVLNSPDGEESFGRIASQAARQVIIQKIGDTEKQKIYELFKDKAGTALNMKVVMVESGKVIFDYNGNQIILPKSEQSSKDNYAPDAKFYIYVSEVSDDEKTGPKVVLSRKDKGLVKELFSMYVPEVADGSIIIENIVRYPGVKSKILVSSKNTELDPSGTLIGPKGIRVKSIMEELSLEKIDIITNTGNIEEMVAKALSPASVLKVEIDNAKKVASAYVTTSERAKAIGKNGINIKLASDLVGYIVSIVEVKE